jgi:hypothetical protein
MSHDYPTCKYCGKECRQAPSQRRAKKGIGGRTQCNSCSVTKRRWKTKIELVNALGGKCERCGWTGHPGGFQFHHKDPEEKNFALSGNKLLVKERLDEVKKCQLLCACCHSIEHSNTELMRKMGLWNDKPPVTIEKPID